MSNLIGKTIDRYHILEQLGEGGMAIVYKAYDTRLERDVAIKIIRTDVFGSSILDRTLKRFEREAKSLAKLSHPNIVGVIDYGEYDDSPYLVLEYLPAGTLKEHLGKPIPWQEAVRILIPIAEALEYAHEHNIIHRDIKPSNILLTEKGQPMLTDFGIAKILENEDAATLTGTGLGVGTPEYMSPEQWTGSATAQSDIYSLGVVLYEMVTGRKPYTADTPAAILLKQATEPLPRPRSYVNDLPDSIEKILLKALARNPKDRYQGAGALVDGLEGLLIGISKSRKSTVTPNTRTPVEPDLDTQDTYLQGESYATNLHTKAYNDSPGQPPKKIVWWPWAIIVVVILAIIGYALQSQKALQQVSETATIQARATSAQATVDMETTIAAQATIDMEATIATRPLSKDITVFASRGWQDTDMYIQQGESVRIIYTSGKWSACAINGCPFVGLTGNPKDPLNWPDNIIQGCRNSALIARVTDTNIWCVENSALLTVFSSGTIQLRMNDAVIKDNDGSILVQVIIEP